MTYGNRMDFDGRITEDGIAYPIIVEGDDFNIDFTITPSTGEAPVSGATVFGGIVREYNENANIATFEVVSTAGVSGSLDVELSIPADVTSTLAQYGSNWKEGTGDLGYYEVKYTNEDGKTKRALYGKVKISRTSII